MKNPLWLALIIVLLSAGIFALDRAAPAEVACGTLYAAVVLLAIRLPRREHAIWVGWFSSFLVVSGLLIALFLKPFFREPGPAIANAVFEMFAVWVAALYAYHKRGLEQELLEINSDLERRVAKRSAELQKAAEHLQVQIDERRKAESERGRTEAHYLSLIENLPIHVIRKDVEGRFTFVSPSFCELLGKTAEEIIGKTDFAFYPTNLAEKYRADDQTVMRNRRVLNDVEVNESHGGPKTYVQIIKMPIVSPGGAIVGMQCIFWDVSERMRAEDELRESEARKRAIFEAAKDGILFLDENGLVVEANAAAVQILGCHKQELLGQRLAAWFASSESWQRFQESLFRYTGQGDPGSILGRRVELEMRRGNEAAFMAEVATYPIPVKGSGGFAIFFRDVTDRIQRERDLRAAKDAAEAASRAKSLFVANMSHEIRTPLNAVLGLSDLLYSSELSVQQRDYMGMVQEQAEALLAMLNDILDYSKIEAGHLELDETCFDLREWLGDAIKPMGLRAQSRGLELICEVHPRCPRTVVGDQNRLRQVLLNLVGNAIKFTERGEIVVRVSQEPGRQSDKGSDPLAAAAEEGQTPFRTGAESREDRWLLRFTVADTGIGVPPDRQASIFAAFEQADNSITRKYGGTGLGLAIATGLVQLMGGTISLHSTVGQGSTFAVTVPLGKADGTVVKEQDSAALVNLHVLVLDDNQTNGHVLVEMLRQWNMRAEAALTLAEAGQVLSSARERGQDVAVLIVDSEMPEQDGFEAVAELRQRQLAPDATIMMLTAGNGIRNASRCEQERIPAFLMKPVKQSELFDAIVLALKLAPAAAPHVVAAPPHPLPKLRVLLVEDSLVNQKLAVGLLTRHEHVVDVAANGREAVHWSDERDYDLILMDVQMPEMDGLEATRLIRLRERHSGRHVPIVAMTAHAMQGDEETCLASGMDGYIAKPIRAAILFQTIEHVLRQVTPHVFLRLHRDGSVVDWQKASAIVHQDQSLLHEIVCSFLDECPGLLASLRSAALSGSAKDLHHAAHTLKGSARYFGAAQFSELAYQLELLGRDGKLDGVLPLVAELERQAVPLNRDLHSFVGVFRNNQLAVEDVAAAADPPDAN